MNLEKKKTEKELNSHLSTVLAEITGLETEIRAKRQELQTKQNIAGELSNSLKKLKSSGKINISEHALLRYCERVKGIDIEEAKKKILDDQVIGLVVKLGGSGTYPNKEGVSVVMKENTVITILT